MYVNVFNLRVKLLYLLFPWWLEWCVRVEGTWAWFYTEEGAKGEGEAEDGGEGEPDGSRPWRIWWESVQKEGPAWKWKIDPPLVETGADDVEVSLAYLGWAGAGQKVEEFQTKDLREVGGKDLPLWVKAMGAGKKQ